MPYYIVWRVIFILVISIFVCSWVLLPYNFQYPFYNDCIAYEGTVERFGYKSNQTNHYISLDLRDGCEIYINESLIEAYEYDWNSALREIGPGDYVEILAMNEKGSYGPRILSLSCAGENYITVSQSKPVYQDIEISNCKLTIKALHILVLLLLYMGITLAIQLVIVRKIGKSRYLQEKGNGVIQKVAFQLKSALPFLLLLTALLCMITVWPQHKDWEVRMNIPTEQQCISMSGKVQAVKVEDLGESLQMVLDNSDICYAQKEVLGEDYFSMLADIEEGTYAEFLVHSFGIKGEQDPQIISYSGSKGAEISYQQGKDSYLWAAAKEEKKIAFWYIGATILCLIVCMPILWMRKKEGANPDP